MNAYGGHPERKTIAAYLARTAGAADMMWVNEHVQYCIRCYRIMAEERLPEPARAPFAVSAVSFPVRAPASSGRTQGIVSRLVRRLRPRHGVSQRVPEPPPLTAFARNLPTAAARPAAAA